jgi:hypothetical protein
LDVCQERAAQRIEVFEYYALAAPIPFEEKITMLSQFLRKKQVAPKNRHTSRTCQPSLEILEDRKLMSIAAGPIVNPANGHTYYLLALSNWTAAEAEAVGLGGHLATISDAAENTWVFDTFNRPGQFGLWIGLSDAATEGQFVWVSGETDSYRNWLPDQPDDWSGEDYVHMWVPTDGFSYTPGRWNDFRDDAYTVYPSATYFFQGVVEVATTLSPTVQSTLVNDGSSQRSMVNNLWVGFSTVVSIDPGAFEVRHQSGELVSLSVWSGEYDGRTWSYLTFTGPGIIGGSLADGNYILTIFGGLVHGLGGADLDGDYDGTPGGDYTEAFSRLFGDSDGDRDVDLLDVAQFFSTYRRRAGDSGFLWYFDYDGDGHVHTADLLAFADRYDTTLAP